MLRMTDTFTRFLFGSPNPSRNSQKVSKRTEDVFTVNFTILQFLKTKQEGISDLNVARIIRTCEFAHIHVVGANEVCLLSSIVQTRRDIFNYLCT